MWGWGGGVFVFASSFCVVMNKFLYITRVQFSTSSLISYASRCVCVVDKVATSFSYTLGFLMGIMFILLINLQQLFGHYVSFIYEVVATFRALCFCF